MEGLVQLPAKWQKWSAIDLIGQGTYGKVYKAECEDGRLAAIKVINIRIDGKTSQASENFGDEESLRNYYFDMVMNFSFEIRLMEQLKDCPHVVQIYDSQITEDKDCGGWTIYIMMEYLHDISQLMASFGELDEKKIAEFGMQICEALEVCEEKKIVHRDIKPENIMVSDDGVYKLGDFGVAKLIEGTVDFGSIQGTYSYMAPEITRLQKYGNRADIYSLGMVLYHLLNRNRDPFIDPKKRLITYKEKEIAVERRLKGDPMLAPIDASPEMAEIILKACEFEPEDRYAHIDELKKDLDLLRNGKYRLKKNKKGRSRKVVLSRKQVRISIAVGILLVGLAIFAGLRVPDLIYYIRPKESEDHSYEYSLTRDGVLEIKSLKSGCTLYISNNNFPWDYYKDKIKSIKFVDSFSYIVGFDNCTELEEVQGLENVTEIGAYAFSGCVSLNSVDGLENVETIEQFAFEGCSNLKSVDLPNINKIEQFSGNAFDDTPYLKAKMDNGFWIEDQTLIRYYGDETDIKIPENVTKIGDNAFEGLDIETVSSMENVTTIGESSFEDCGSLESISGTENVVTIDAFAFSNCSVLENIGSMGNVETIGNNAFQACTALKSITGLKNVKTIGPQAFSECSSLENVRDIKKVTTIDDYAFEECVNLKTIDLPDISKMTYLSGTAFDGSKFLEEKQDKGFWIENNILLRYCGDETDVTIPENVTEIGISAFFECKVKKISGMEKIRKIDDYAFYDCEKLESISDMENVKQIGDLAFNDCKALESVSGLKNIEKIGEFAFSDCKALKSVSDLKNVDQIGDYAFGNCTSLDKKSLKSQLPDNCKVSELAFSDFSEDLFQGDEE